VVVLGGHCRNGTESQRAQWPKVAESPEAQPMPIGTLLQDGCA
jgi:hypothetical protein